MEYLIYGDDEGDRDPVLQRAFAQGTDPSPATPSTPGRIGLHHKLIVTIANAYLNEHLQSPPDLHETSKLSHPVLTDH